MLAMTSLSAPGISPAPILDDAKRSPAGRMSFARGPALMIDRAEAANRLIRDVASSSRTAEKGHRDEEDPV
jgi:hypothetical protein